MAETITKTTRCRAARRIDAIDLSVSNRFSSISFSINAGEVLAIIGPNGAGKSSVLKTLAGDLAPSSGRVLLNQQLLSQWPIAQRAQQLAVFSQQQLLDFPFQVAEVVALGRSPHRQLGGIDWTIIAEVMALVDVVRFSRRSFIELSGGEQQRVHLARVLAQIWDVPGGWLFLDEADSALDLAQQQLLKTVINTATARGIGVIMVSHDINLAASCANRLLGMAGGRCEFIGAPVEVLETQSLSQLFSAAVTVIANPTTQKPMVVIP